MSFDASMTAELASQPLVADAEAPMANVEAGEGGAGGAEGADPVMKAKAAVQEILITYLQPGSPYEINIRYLGSRLGAVLFVEQLSCSLWTTSCPGLSCLSPSAGPSSTMSNTVVSRVKAFLDKTPPPEEIPQCLEMFSEAEAEMVKMLELNVLQKFNDSPQVVAVRAEEEEKANAARTAHLLSILGGSGTTRKVEPAPVEELAEDVERASAAGFDNLEGGEGEYDDWCI